MRAHGARLLMLLLTSAWALRAVGAPSPVFIETEVAPRDPYVQAAARVTVRVYSARVLYRSDLDLPAPPDALVRQLGGDDHGTARRENRTYDVLTRRYLVFAQRSGKLTLPGALLSAQILTAAGRSSPFNNDPSSAPLGGSTYAYGALSVAVEPLMLRGDSIVLDVRPRPAGGLSSYWMPARQVSVTSAWHPESSEARVGDALTLNLAVQADGLPAEQLPDLSALLSVPAGLKAYPDEPKLENANRDDSLVGRREQNIALIADQPGRFTLPALKLRWWDTARNRPEEVTVPAKTLVVLPPVAASTALPRAVSPGPGGPGAIRWAVGDPWRWVSLGLALAWLATLAIGYGARARPRSPAPPVPGPSASRCRARFLDACRANDARAARRHLLAWAGATLPSAPAGLNGMARLSGNAELVRLLRDLDRACYAGGPWQGGPLARALHSLPPPQHGSPPRSSSLAPLYR
ncbi:MAG TPA: hypothetical protein VMU40_21470 [Steroidobacteraceae bacterium]|nr:hypothetical protein [Steroidobacteraceae bacterium]